MTLASIETEMPPLSSIIEQAEVEPTNFGISAVDANPSANTVRRRYYGGFSTSICQFFDDPRRRNDCCALACLGVLSSDRTRHLMYDHQPQLSTSPSFKRLWATRLGVNVGLPILLLMLGRIVLKYIDDKDTKSQVSTILSIAFIALIVLLQLLAYKARVKTRTDLMRLIQEKTFLEGGEEGPDTTERIEHLIHGQNSIRHAHGCISGHPKDENQDFINSPLEDENRSDLCTKIWNFSRSFCCGSFCGCWIQCCGMCAIGQEEREINQMLPRPQQMIDYISFQPYVEYYSSIQLLRQNANGSLTAHFKALSELSKLLLRILISFLLLCFLYSLLDFNKNFTLANLLVLLATFGQAFFILYFVHWKWHRFDLSLDAVVKYFGCGFLISVSFAMVYEILLQTVLAIVGAIVIVVEILADGTAEKLSNKDLSDKEQNQIYIDFLKNHPGLILIATFLNAFLVAAFVEELSKYFGYWMIEHPDFLPPKELEEQEIYIHASRSEEGGTNPGYSKSTHLATDERKLNQIGAAITIAMVAVATGFACCENIMYIFVYTPSNLSQEISTLVARSIFPVHPLCAALQSIGICRRDLEKDSSMKLGKAILPALLLHGTFDFILMAIGAFSSINQSNQEKKDQEDTTDLDDLFEELPILGISMSLVIIFATYYIIASRKQKVRLDQMYISELASQVEQGSLLT